MLSAMIAPIRSSVTSCNVAYPPWRRVAIKKLLALVVILISLSSCAGSGLFVPGTHHAMTDVSLEVLNQSRHCIGGAAYMFLGENLPEAL